MSVAQEKNLRAFLRNVGEHFDVCVIDKNPNADIRIMAALASADHVLCPIQLNQESIDGIAKFLLDGRVGLVFVQAALNPRLRLLGLLPNLVEPTAFQKANWAYLMATGPYRKRLLALVDQPSEQEHYARISKRTAIAQAQATGAVMRTRKDKTAWRVPGQKSGPSWTALRSSWGFAVNQHTSAVSIAAICEASASNLTEIMQSAQQILSQFITAWY